MKKHIKNYLDFFNYGEQDFIPSELSGGPAVDIHHIEFGRYKRSDNIDNLIALTREEHDQAHFKKQPFLTKKYLFKKHEEFKKKKMSEMRKNEVIRSFL
jgi:hypothetical protein